MSNTKDAPAPPATDEATGLPVLANGGTVDVSGWAPVTEGVLSERTAEQFVAMAWLLPRKSTADATDKILAQLLSATTPDEFNEPWEKQGLERLFGVKVAVERVFLLESKYREGAGVYLRAEGYDVNTEREVGFNTSSWQVMGTLTALYVREMLPAVVVGSQSDEPTSAGYRPHHLAVLSTARKGKSDGAG
jgi:hypothetical protein